MELFARPCWKKIVDSPRPRSPGTRSKPSGNSMFYVVFLGNCSKFHVSSLTCPEHYEVGGPNAIISFCRWGDWGMGIAHDLPRVMKLVGNSDQCGDQKGRSVFLHVLSRSHGLDRSKHMYMIILLAFSPRGSLKLLSAPDLRATALAQQRPCLLFRQWDKAPDSFSEICFPLSTQTI